MESQPVNSKKWYARNGWIISLLVLFFPVGLFLMWKYASWNKAIKWVVTIIFALGLFANISSSHAKQAQNQQTNQSSNNSAPTATEAPTAIPKPLTMDDKLWQAFNKVFDDRYKKGTQIKYTATDKTVVLIQEPGKYWSETNLYDLDEKRLVETAISSFVQYGREAFKIEGVNRVGVDYRMPFTDSYGKETVSTAFSFSMTKEEFQKYNWNNLNGKPIYYQIIRSTTDDPLFSIDPAILRKIDPATITLHI